jgi:hypothetical protein
MGHFGVVQTTSKLEPMLGRGNVLIKHLVVDKKTGKEHVRKTRLWPVFYFKGRSDLRLISSGQLLRSGLRLEADAETSNFFDERGRNVLQILSDDSLDPYQDHEDAQEPSKGSYTCRLLLLAPTPRAPFRHSPELIL